MKKYREYHKHQWEILNEVWHFCACGLEKWICYLPDGRYVVTTQNKLEMRRIWNEIFILVDMKNRWRK